MKAIFVIAILVPSWTAAAESQRARVIDAKGVQVELTNVRAVYVAQEGVFVSEVPEKATASLVFTLVKPDDAKERIELPFSRIRRIRYSPYQGPKSLEHFDVELTSGSTISVDMDRLQESDTGGKVVRTVPVKFFAFWNGEVPAGYGRSTLLELQYIAGSDTRAVSAVRRIRRADVRAIVFLAPEP